MSPGVNESPHLFDLVSTSVQVESKTNQDIMKPSQSVEHKRLTMNLFFTDDDKGYMTMFYVSPQLFHNLMGDYVPTR